MTANDNLRLRAKFVRTTEAFLSLQEAVLSEVPASELIYLGNELTHCHTVFARDLLEEIDRLEKRTGQPA